MPYVPHTDRDVREMLDVLGLQDVDELFASLPPEVRCEGPLDLPDGLSEQEVWRALRNLAALNAGVDDLLCFLGGGVYDTAIPAAVDTIASRSEFLTAYTPYQAEVSQGTLQVIYDWQTCIARLTGLPVSNASMYDGASALAEAVLMALTRTRRSRVVLPAALLPRWRRVVESYLEGREVELATVPTAADGTTDPAVLADLLDETVACVVVQDPNGFGCLEPAAELAAAATAVGALTIAAVNPVALGLVTPPGEYGAAIAVGEAQPLGVPLSWGGPLLGFMACREDLLRLLPGRVVGRTVDGQGRTGCVLTLQTREQHIRRERATSNICSNQGLNVVRAVVHLSLLGGEGLRELALAWHTRAVALADRLAALDGVVLPHAAAFFNEFVVRLPRPARDFRAYARDRGLLAGIVAADWWDTADPGDLLVAVTEKRSAADLDRYVQVLSAWLAAEESDDA